MNFFSRNCNNFYGIQGHSNKTVTSKTDSGLLDKLPEAVSGSVIKLISHHFPHFSVTYLAEPSPGFNLDF